MPAPPPMKTMSEVRFSRRVQVPKGASTSMRVPTVTSFSRNCENRPSG